MDLLELEHTEDKCKITVEYLGEQYTVSWYRGMDSSDVREAIMCACDCIVDAGFKLIDSGGFPVPIEALQEGEIYTIQPGEEIKGFEKVLGDRWRRVNVEIDPLQHSEANCAIELMKQGANLLKHTRNSMPHIRLFQLTNDLKYLIWYTSNKTNQEASVPLKDINSVQTGQSTENFKRYPIETLSHLSFSVLYKGKTLDVTCRDEKEFDFWVAGLKALMFHYKGLQVSKQILLSHSRRFLEYLRHNQINEATNVIYQEPNSKKLEDAIIRKPLTKEQVCDKLVRNRQRIENLFEEFRNLPSCDSPEMLSVLSSKKSAYGGEYVEVLLDEEDQDELYATQDQRLEDILESCKLKLEQLETTDPNSSLESELWKLEIDIENASDIIKRISSMAEPKWSEKLKGWFKKLF